MDLGRELAVVSHAVVVGLGFLGATLGLDKLPLVAHVGNLGLPVLFGVVGLGQTLPALPHGQMLRVDSNAVVLAGTAVADVAPAALLLLEIETGGIGQENKSEKHTGETEPRDNVELGLVVNVLVKDRGEQGTSLTQAGGEAVGGGADGRGENLTSNEEGDGVGAKLVEEGGDKVHGLEAVDAGGGLVVVVLEGGDDKHEEAHEEADLLHHLAAVELVVDEERGEVVAGERDGNVDEVPGPVGHERLGVVGDDLDELALEKLVTVEEDVVAEPGTGGGDETAAKLAKARLEGIDIVAGDVGAGLGLGKLLGGVGHLPGTVVDEPEGADGGEGKGEAEDDLGGVSKGLAASRGGGVAVAAVEDEEEDNQEDLVGELAPALHEEGHGDTAATVQTILLGRELARGDGALERRGGRDGVLATNTERVEEEGPGVANDPALEGETPRGCEHEQTNEHDDGVLNQTPATADPVTNDTDNDLANHDADNLEVCDRGEPVLAADAVGLGVVPALGPGSLEEGLQVANGEEDVALETETSTGDDGVAEVPGDGGEGIRLHHGHDGVDFLRGGLLVDLCDKLGALAKGQIGPVDALRRVGVIGASDVAEDALLVGRGAGKLVAII